MAHYLYGLVPADADRLETFLDRCDQIAQRVSSVGRSRTVGPLPPYPFAAPDGTTVGGVTWVS